MKKKVGFTALELENILFIVEHINEVKNFEELNDMSINELTIADLKNTKKYLRAKNREYAALKKHFLNVNEAFEFEKYKKLLHDCKLVQKKVNKIEEEYIEQKLTASENSKKENDVSKAEKRRQIVVDNLLRLNFYFQDSDKELFEKYINSADYEERIGLLLRLRVKYIEATVYLYRAKKETMEKYYKIVAAENGLGPKLEKNKKEFKLLLEQDKYKNYKEIITKAKMAYNKSKLFMSNIERLIAIENSIYNNSIPKKDLDYEDESDYKELIQGVYPDCKEFVDRLNNIRSGRYSRRYGTSIKNFIPKDLEHLFTTLEKLELDYEALMDIALLGMDVVKNKLKTLKQGQNEYDDAERIFLKKLVKKFEDLKPFIPYEEEVDTKVYYKILESLIYNDDNFTYLEKLIRQIDGCKNARKDNKHIILELLDKFIMNYKLKLINQHFEYIEPDFYKEVIKVFYDNKVVLKDEEIKEINERLDEFLEYCQRHKYASMSEIVNDVNELRNNRVDKEKRNYDKEKVKQEQTFIEFYMDSLVNYYMRRNYPIYIDSDETSVFMLENVDNIGFSVGHDENGTITLGVHLLDTSKVVSDDSEMVKASLAGKKVLPKLDEEKVYPVMSFTYSLVNGYELTNMRLAPGLIKVNKTYSDEDINAFREKEDLKELMMITSHLQDENDYKDIHFSEGIKEVILKAISKDVKRRFEQRHIPFIYEKDLENSEELIKDNHNAICDKLIEIPKREAYQIFDILDHVVDKYYVPEVTSDLDINLDSSSFLGYYLLNVLNKIETGKYEIDKEVAAIEEYLGQLNSNRKYLPSSITKKNQSKLKRVARQYKKRR